MRAFQTTGILSLDFILAGGWPQGRCSELYGPLGSGCTTVALHTLAAAQRAGQTACLVAHSTCEPDRVYARRLGADVHVAVCADGGELAKYTEHLLGRRDAPDLLVVELGRQIDPTGSDALSKVLRHYSNRQRKTTLLFVTENGAILPLRYYSAARVQLQREGTAPSGEDLVTAKVVKLKHPTALPFQATALQLTAGDGVDLVKDLIRAAAASGTLRRHDIEQYVHELADNALERSSLTDSVRRKLYLQGLPS